MKIKDNLYGFQIIEDKSLISLINSDSIQRLKDISQLGMPDEYYHIKGFSRYEHSIGVMVLLKNLGASLEEQVAGLLHDASHAPFSHVVDWAIGDPTKEDYQDNIHQEFLQNSEIPGLLKRYGFNIESIANYKNFKLLERDPPSLCADRLDYSIREMEIQKGKSFAKKIVNNLSVKNSQIIFLDEHTATFFANEYMNLQREHWGGNEARSRYYILSEVLKKAFKDNLLVTEDLKKTEGHMLKILNESQDDFILRNLNLLKNGFKVIPDENGIELKKKFRYIDPEVLVNGTYYSLSKISEEYFNLIESEKKKNHELNKVKIVPN
jgi:uncharacterized protein